MAAGIGSMNVFYTRYSDAAGIAATVQPGFAVSDYADPGWGWDRFRYYQFNADYVRILDNGSVGVVSSYVRHNENNQPVSVSSYFRYDSANVGYSTRGTNIPNIQP